MVHNHIFVIRHGESENNILQIDSAKLENKDKFGLTDKGKKQIELETKKFTDFDLIITSPLRRAKETAMIFAKTSKCKVIENDLLSEVDHGDFELCSYEETDSFLADHNDESVPFPNGESLLDAKNRTVQFLKKLNQNHLNKRILIVTHGHIALFILELLSPDFNRQEAIKNYNDDKSRQVTEIPLVDTSP